MLHREQCLESARSLARDVERPLGLKCAVLEDPAAILGAESPGLAKIDPTRWVGISVASAPGIAAGIEVDDADSDPAQVAYRLAVLIQEDLCLRTGRIWPVSDTYPDTPLIPTSRGWSQNSGRGANSSSVIVEYGAVQTAGDRRPLADGTVRWWIDNPGWGVIASNDGDIAFAYFELAEQDRSGDLGRLAGNKMHYRVTGRKRGVYRAAEVVSSRPLGSGTPADSGISSTNDSH